MVTDKTTKNPVIEITKQFEFQGTLKFRVKQGSVEVFGREFNGKSSWHSIVSDGKKDLLYPIVKIG